MGNKRHTESGIHRFTDDGRVVTDGDEDDYENGRENGHDTAPRPPDPTNLYALAYRLAKDFGILAVICGAMMYANWKMFEYHRTDAAKAHDEFSKVMQSIASNQVQTNVELVKIGDALDRHLAADENEKRGKVH